MEVVERADAVVSLRKAGGRWSEVKLGASGHGQRDGQLAIVGEGLDVGGELLRGPVSGRVGGHRAMEHTFARAVQAVGQV
eukprot:3937513-Rhodomonas_salina.2